MDRNAPKGPLSAGPVVALRKESVDRNFPAPVIMCSTATSLSARRAWIEITHCQTVSRTIQSLSARRAWIEITSDADWVRVYVSLSARRAWIEIAGARPARQRSRVALRKESVDRNQQNVGQNYIAGESLSARRAWIEIINRLLMYNCLSSRSPQGERG